MPQPNQGPDDKPIQEGRTPLDNDVDPDGMDSATEGDDLEAGSDDAGVDGPDGASDRRSAGQSRTSGTHGEARADIPPDRR